MTRDNAAANSRDDRARGDEALAAAELLVAHGFANDAVSRAYYAAHFWASALLAAKGLEAKTHRGTIQLVGLHYVRPGLLAEEMAAHLGHLETFRELSDYRGEVDFTTAEAQAEIARAEAFIEACRSLLSEPGDG